MRPRRSKASHALVVGWVGMVLLGSARVARGQTGTAAEGAGVLEFVLPTGARSLGMGQAAVASAVGSDGIWWNPAVIARGPRELALHIAQSPANTVEGDASATLVIPIQRLGAVAISFRYLNLGSIDVGLTQASEGTAQFTSAVLAGTFAAPFGDRLSVGLTFKLFRLITSCTGGCEAPSTQPTTGAIDLGGQYFLTKDSAVAIGAAVRDLGLRLQVNDAPQADLLPGRAEFGIAFAPKLARLPKEIRVRTATDVVIRTSLIGDIGYRAGGEVAWQERYQGRVGYVIRGPTGSGPTFGAGFSTGKLQIDFAQMLSDYGAQSGSPATYLSLRYIF